MMLSSPAGTCMKNILGLTMSSQIQLGNLFYDITLRAPSSTCYFRICTGKPKLRYTSGSAITANYCTSTMGSQASRWSCVRSQNMNLRLLVPNHTNIPKIKYNKRPGSWRQRCGAAGLFVGVLVCYSSSEPSYAEAPEGRASGQDGSDSSPSHYSHGKKVVTDYAVIGIPGDGRCLFRSVAHGACMCSGKPAPDEIRQRALADELRAKVADEFLRRREETEWFIEGDFDTYVSQIRKSHVWGGEPELLMASHVLQMPITVYMYDQDSGGLISIAEYGQEYGKDNPIKVLYHGFGHYDALQIPGKKGGRSRL